MLLRLLRGNNFTHFGKRSVSFASTEQIKDQAGKIVGFISIIENDRKKNEDKSHYQERSESEVSEKIHNLLGDDAAKVLVFYVDQTSYKPEPLSEEEAKKNHTIKKYAPRGGHLASAVLTRDVEKRFTMIPGTQVSKVPGRLPKGKDAESFVMKDTVLTRQSMSGDAKYEDAEAMANYYSGADFNKGMKHFGSKEMVIIVNHSAVNVNIERLQENIKKLEKEDRIYDRLEGACGQAVQKAFGILSKKEISTQLAAMAVVGSILIDPSTKDSFRDAAARSGLSLLPQQVFESGEGYRTEKNLKQKKEGLTAADNKKDSSSNTGGLPKP